MNSQLFLEVNENDPYSDQERETILKTSEDFILRTQLLLLLFIL